MDQDDPLPQEKPTPPEVDPLPAKKPHHQAVEYDAEDQLASQLRDSGNAVSEMQLQDHHPYGSSPMSTLKKLGAGMEYGAYSDSQKD